MKFDENLAAVHAYLCADGYLTSPDKWKNYVIGFRNTNLILLKDFQKRFRYIFRIKPIIGKDGRCYKNSKEIHQKLINSFGSFRSKEWAMPKLNNKLLKIWLRAFFDCEGWVYCKSHQNRHIGVDSINERGLDQIIKALNKLGIKTIKRIYEKRNIYRIFIYRKDSLIKFKEKICFLHPEKAKKLDKTIADYVNYFWDFPKKEKNCEVFIKTIFKEKARIKKPYYIRIICRERINLDQLKKLLKEFYDINCIVNKSVNGLGTVYHELNINKKEEIEELMKLKLIPNIFKHK